MRRRKTRKRFTFSASTTSIPALRIMPAHGLRKRPRCRRSPASGGSGYRDVQRPLVIRRPVRHAARLPDIKHHLDIMPCELDITDQRLHHIIGRGHQLQLITFYPSNPRRRSHSLNRDAATLLFSSAKICLQALRSASHFAVEGHMARARSARRLPR